MQIPRVIRLLGKKYRVVTTPHIDDCGNTEASKCTIWINVEIDEQQIRDTLLHEIIHAIDYEYHLKMEERQVHCMATSLLALFKENPTLSKFLGITKG